jgi:hypothetical protein
MEKPKVQMSRTRLSASSGNILRTTGTDDQDPLQRQFGENSTKDMSVLAIEEEVDEEDCITEADSKSWMRRYCASLRRIVRD